MANPPMGRNPVRPIPAPLNSPEGQAMAAEREAAAAAKAKELPTWRVGFARIVPWFLAAFLCGLVIQVFLAGYGLGEVGGQGMAAHVEWAHVIELFPVLIAVSGFLGADKWGGWGGVILLAQFQAQYAFISMSNPILRALHPTNGVLMLAFTLGLLLHRPMWAHAPAGTAATTTAKAE